MSSCFVRPVIATVFVALAAVACAKPSTADRLSLNVADMRLDYSGTGTSLTVHGVPIVRSSVLSCEPPSWGNTYYTPEDQPKIIERAKVTKLEDGGRSVELRHKVDPGRNCPFEATETLTMRPDNSFSTRLQFVFSGEGEVNVDWFPYRFAAGIFAGRPCVLEPSNAAFPARLPDETAAGDGAKARIARGFKVARVDSRFGPVSIEVESPETDMGIEYRRDRWVMSGPRDFFVGIKKERILQKGKVYDYTVTVRFPKTLESVQRAEAVVTEKPNLTEIAEAVVPCWKPGPVIPSPKDERGTSSPLAISPGLRIVTGGKPDAATRHAASFLAAEIKRLTGVRAIVVPDAPQAGHRGGVVTLTPGDASTSAVIAARGLKLAPDAEAYALAVSPDGAVVASHGGRGVFHGAATLAQLIEADAAGARFRGADISDYPSLQYRGVHCLSGRGAADQISRAMRELMARYKLNSLVWECQFIEWDSQPDIHHPVYGMKKSDARQVIAAARENLIDLTPLVHSLGHSEWIFTNGRNMDLAEDPDRPYSYAVGVARTYEFIYKVYAEAMDLFRTPQFHIGHDEFTMRGRYPFRSKHVGTTTDIFLKDIASHHAWFAKQGVRLMMWGDQLLHKTEAADAGLAPTKQDAKLRRDGVPKDITICDWHYAPVPAEKQVSLKILKDAGFRVIGCGWFEVDNIRNLAKACLDAGVLGYLQTTWAGFNFDINGQPENWMQYWAYILAAEYSWSGRNIPASQLGWEAREVFMDTWFGRTPAYAVRGGFTVDLDAARNRSLSDKGQADGWTGTGAAFDLSAFPAGKMRLYGVEFDASSNAKGAGAVMLRGRLKPTDALPTSLAVNFAAKGEKVSELHFLATAGFPEMEGTHCGQVVIRYADGGTASLPLVYGRNLFAANDFRMSREAFLAWKGTNRAGQPIGLWDVAWKNPAPARRISGFRVESSGSCAAPVILAVTGVR